MCYHLLGDHADRVLIGAWNPDAVTDLGLQAVPERRLFSASDTNRDFATTMFLPPDFKVSAMLEGFKKTAAKYAPEMRRLIDAYGWPPAVPPGCAEMTQPTFRIAGDHSCSECGSKYRSESPGIGGCCAP